MTAKTLNDLLKAGSDNPPIDFVPRNVKIGQKEYKEIWLNNQKQVSSAFIERLSIKNNKRKVLKLYLSDGYTYYAKIVDGVPVFYKKVRSK